MQTPQKPKQPLEEGQNTLYRGGYSVFDSPSYKQYQFGYFTKNKEKALGYSRHSRYNTNPDALWSYKLREDTRLLSGQYLERLLNRVEYTLQSYDPEKTPFKKDENNRWVRNSQDSETDHDFFQKIKKKVYDRGYQGIDMVDYQEVLIYDLSLVEEQFNRLTSSRVIQFNLPNELKF
tara:strand:- start:316 stop:846 length:531 start_codon:yes stop_codon:yes gene_type:complete